MTDIETCNCGSSCEVQELGDIFWVECMNLACEAMSPNADTPAEAIENHNQRVTAICEHGPLKHTVINLVSENGKLRAEVARLREVLERIRDQPEPQFPTATWAAEEAGAALLEEKERVL